ncbi:MAG: efflux RND transporter permease subunit, partial [Pseudomonadota bacterium]
MIALEALIRNRRLVFSLIAILFVVGVISFGSMARQEDPSFPYRAGLIRVIYPGGSPAQIEQLITNPLEEQLAQIEEIDKYTSNSRDDIAIVSIELKDAIYDTDAAWNRVERAIERARNEFPSGVVEIDFDDRQIDLPVAVISITGSTDLIALKSAAERLKTRLISLPSVSRIEIEGQPEEEIVVKIRTSSLEQLGLSRDLVRNTLASRNQLIPGGAIVADNKTIRLNNRSDYATLEDIKRTTIRLNNGQLIPLSSVAEVALEPRLPLASQRFDNGVPAISLGIIAERGQTDVVRFGEILRARLAEVKPEFEPLSIEESFFQPDYVSDRLKSLQGSLMLSVLIIAAVVFLALGWRTGILVSAVLPVVSLMALGIYNIGGGVFHQIAVVGIVISLGILIDNAIVVVEFIETKLRAGASRAEAMRESILAMAKPLLASTGTTIAAFIPLLLAKGGVGDFTRAIPTMIVIALTVSYIVSVFVWPLLAFYWLKSRAKSEEGTPAKSSQIQAAIDKLSTFCARVVIHQPKRVLVLVALSVSISLLLAPTLKQQFFPATDRNQFVIDIEFPVSTPLAVTESISAKIEDELVAQDAVARVYRSVGGSGYRFYYNMGGKPDESHIARITVSTAHGGLNQGMVDWVRNDLSSRYPEATLIPRTLGQGPPRPAPIEVRAEHPDPDVLFKAVQKLRAQLASIEGVADLRSNLDLGTPELALDIKDYLTLREGVVPGAVANSVFSTTRGLPAGQYRYAEDPVPIRVRSVEGESTDTQTLINSYVTGGQNQRVPLGQVSTLETNWAATNIRHYNGARSATILAELAPGGAYNFILAKLTELMEADPPPIGVNVVFGGDAAASQEANSNIATGAPLSLALLIFFMMLQFNSFRRIGIIFVTIPLAAVGVIPGLALSGQPFGFQSLLGVIALIGIVVNNAIVLIDVVDKQLAAGQSIHEAVSEALRQRTSPILLTTATTILGLLPLAFSASTLWPPMAWAIISGLLLSTILTLVAIPALCIALLGKKRSEQPPIEASPFSANKGVNVGAIALVCFLIAGLGSSDRVYAETNDSSPSSLDKSSLQIGFQQVVDRAAQNHRARQLGFEASASRASATSINRQSWAPSVSLGGSYSRRDEGSSIVLPTGPLEVSEEDSYVYEVKVTQPLFRPSQQLYRSKAAGQQAEGSRATAQRVQRVEIANAIKLYTALLGVDADLRANLALTESFEAREARIADRVQAGTSLRSDLLQIQVELNRAQQTQVELSAQKSILGERFASALDLEVGQLFGLDFDLSLLDSLQWQALDRRAEELCDQRADCLAVKAKINSLELESKALLTDSLPNIDLSYSDTRSDGQVFVAEEDQRLMLEFSWSLFTSGARYEQRKSSRLQVQAAQQELALLLDQINIERTSASTARTTAQSAIALAKINVELGEERLRLVRVRYDNGLTTLDRLLEAEAGLVSAQA